MVNSTNHVIVTDDALLTLDKTLYTLTVWDQEEVLTRRFLGFGRIINLQGYVVKANTSSISSALRDFASQPFQPSPTNGAHNNEGLVTSPETSATTDAVGRQWDGELADGEPQLLRDAAGVFDQLQHGAVAGRFYLLVTDLSRGSGSRDTVRQPLEGAVRGSLDGID